MSSGALAWLTAGRTFGYKEFAFNADFYGWLVEEVEKFWVDNVLKKCEPELVDAADVIAKFARHTDGKFVEASTETLAAVEELKVAEERKDALENRIKLAFGDAESLTYCGETLATWKAAKDSVKFDSKAFLAQHPEFGKQYSAEHWHYTRPKARQVVRDSVWSGLE